MMLGIVMYVYLGFLVSSLVILGIEERLCIIIEWVFYGVGLIVIVVVIFYVIKIVKKVL